MTHSVTCVDDRNELKEHKENTVSHKTTMERIDVLTKQGIQFNQHAYLGEKKNSFFENKKERKNIHFSFRRERLLRTHYR